MEFIERARELALLGAGLTAPNPIVGAVVVRDGQIVGEGLHQGGPHAEVVALAAAGERSSGATLYCTLEPCKHVGRTGPCVDAISNAGISRVIYAVNDPTALAGGGAEILRSRGVEVTHQPHSRIAFDNRAWLHRAVEGRPYVIAKTAMTIDARIAAADGSSKWITNEASRGDVMSLRAGVDAIITGTGTVLADNPTLNVRVEGRSRQPIRIVVGTREIPNDFHIQQDHGFTQVNSLTEAMEVAATTGANAVLVEAGPTLMSSFFEGDLVDEWWVYIAPRLLGAGKAAINDLGIYSISDAKGLRLVNQTELDGDLRLIYQKGEHVHRNR